MLLVRVVGLLVALALGGCVLMYLLSGERRYLRYARFVFTYAVFACALALLLIFAERLASEF